MTSLYRLEPLLSMASGSTMLLRRGLATHYRMNAASTSSKLAAPSRRLQRTPPLTTSIWQRRDFQSSSASNNGSSSSSSRPNPSSEPSPSDRDLLLASYTGPMASTFRRLKIFSLGSLFLASSFTPIFLLAPSELSMSGRVGLSLTALVTSVVSTSLVGWVGAPCVFKMKLVEDSQWKKPIMELEQMDWKLRQLRTRVYQPCFLRPTSRPFATWELAESAAGGMESEVNTRTATAPSDESQPDKDRILVADTVASKTGKVTGKWWATRSDGGQWACHGEGSVSRHFQVHEELLGEDWKILS